MQEFVESGQGEQMYPGLPPLGLAESPMVAGIVAEYNPFHKGHEWMIQRLRQEAG